MGEDRPSNRPRLTRKGRATRERIITAAAAEIFHNGVAGTSLDEVRGAANVSGSQMYHYFDDKHDLVLAVIDHQIDAVLEAQEPILSHLDSIEAFETWRDLMIDVQRRLDYRGGCPVGTIGVELAGTDTDARRAICTGFDRWRDRIRTGLHTMRDKGELQSDTDIDALSLAIFTAVQGGLALTQIRRDTSALEAILNTLIAHLRTLHPGARG